jgi:hypothetical protein
VRFCNKNPHSYLILQWRLGLRCSVDQDSERGFYVRVPLNASTANGAPRPAVCQELKFPTLHRGCHWKVKADHTMQRWKTDCYAKLNVTSKAGAVAQSEILCVVYFEIIRKITKNLSLDSWTPYSLEPEIFGPRYRKGPSVSPSRIITPMCHLNCRIRTYCLIFALNPVDRRISRRFL